MTEAEMDLVLQDAWAKIKRLQEAMRQERKNRPVCMHSLKKGTSCSGPTDVKSIFKQTRRQMNIIRQAGSEFLEMHGYTTGGNVRKVNPHAPKVNAE